MISGLEEALKKFYEKCDMEVTLTQNGGLEGLRIGLLGGSFNPAHDGHLQMSLFALARLKLDVVFWIVSPGNPLKKNQEMLGFYERFEKAKSLTKDCAKIVISDIENELQIVYTIDTVRALKTRFPASHFVWLMGADNMQMIHLWRDWEALFCELPIAIFKRSGYLDSCERGEAAARFANAELPLTAAEDLAVAGPPAWVVLDNTPNPLSATQIRQHSKPT